MMMMTLSGQAIKEVIWVGHATVSVMQMMRSRLQISRKVADIDTPDAILIYLVAIPFYYPISCLHLSKEVQVHSRI